LYGALAYNHGCLFLQPLAACVTALSRKAVHVAIDVVKSKGFGWLMSDTDSVFATIPKEI
jgi:DNA polymerase elongation subunit (family B)